MVRNTTESPVLLTHGRSGKLIGKLIDSIDVRRLTARAAAFVAIGGAALTGTACSSHNTTEIAYESGKDKLNSMQEAGYDTPADPGVFDGNAIIPADTSALRNGDLNNDGQLTREERDAMKPGDYAELPDEVIAADRAERFNTYLQTAWETIQKPASEGGGELTSEERAVLSMPDLNKPREQWTDQDYLNYYTLALWLVTTQGDNPTEGERALAAVATPGTTSYKYMEQWMLNNPGRGLKAIYRADPSRFNNSELAPQTVGDVVITEKGGRFIAATSLHSGKTNYTLFVNRGDTNGNLLTTDAYTYETLSDPNLNNLVTRQ